MARGIRPETRIRKDDRNFRRDVIKAKMEYRKRRTYIILTIALILLSFIFIRTYFYSREKAELENNLRIQEAEIVSLQNDSKVNTILIAKLKDPNFIIDFVRQEYYIGYPGEILFSMPSRENYLENARKSIMLEDLDRQIAEISQSRVLNEDQIKSIMREKIEEKKRIEEAKIKLADEQKEQSVENLLAEESISTESTGELSEERALLTRQTSSNIPTSRRRTSG